MLSLSDDEVNGYNPTNRLITKTFIEDEILSLYCGYKIRIGLDALPKYQQAFVHKSIFRKNIATPRNIVEKFIIEGSVEIDLLKEISEHPTPPLGTYKFNPQNPLESLPVIFSNTYETMEFVGDGYINAIIGEYVRNRYPDQSEKFYHNIKTYIISKNGLSVLGKSLKLGEYALISPKTEETIGRQNPSLNEDVFEALCCAIVDDLGLSVLRLIVKNLIESKFDLRNAIINDTNYKDILKRVCKENGWPLPDYIDFGSNGKYGQQIEYTAGIKMIPSIVAFGIRPKKSYLGEKEIDLWAMGSGPIKKKAQQQAAFNALKILELTPREAGMTV